MTPNFKSSYLRRAFKAQLISNSSDSYYCCAKSKVLSLYRVRAELGLLCPVVVPPVIISPPEPISRTSNATFELGFNQDETVEFVRHYVDYDKAEGLTMNLARGGFRGGFLYHNFNFVLGKYKAVYAAPSLLVPGWLQTPEVIACEIID